MRTRSTIVCALIVVVLQQVVGAGPATEVAPPSEGSRANASAIRDAARTHLRQRETGPVQTIVFEKTGISIAPAQEVKVLRKDVRYPTDSWSKSFLDEVQVVMPGEGSVTVWSSPQGSMDLATRVRARVDNFTKRALETGDHYVAGAITPFKTQYGIAGLTYYSESKPHDGCKMGQARNFLFYTESGRYINVTTHRGGGDKALEELSHPLNVAIISSLKLVK